MGHIEPELTSENAKMVDQRYANETAQDHAHRMKRYAHAFERCQKAYDEYMQALDAQVKRYRREAFAYVETKDSAHNDGILDAFSTLFQQLPA